MIIYSESNDIRINYVIKIKYFKDIKWQFQLLDFSNDLIRVVWRLTVGATVPGYPVND